MIRGTTPTITYNIPTSISVSSISKIRMYFIQGNETILTKDEVACTKTVATNSVSATLSQAETFLFSDKKKLITKSRFLLSDGKVVGTKPKEITIESTGGNDEVLTLSAGTE